MAPETLEGASPFVQRTNGVGVRAIEHAAAVAAHANQADVAEDAEMLGDGGLLEAEGAHDITDRTLLQSQEGQNVAAARLGDGVESVGSGGGTWHGERIHSHMGICQEESDGRPEIGNRRRKQSSKAGGPALSLTALHGRIIPLPQVNTGLGYRVCGCPVLDAFHGRVSWLDFGREYENRIERRGRSVGVVWRRMVPAGSQCVARQFYVGANAMGDARRSCSWVRHPSRYVHREPHRENGWWISLVLNRTNRCPSENRTAATKTTPTIRNGFVEATPSRPRRTFSVNRVLCERDGVGMFLFELNHYKPISPEEAKAPPVKTHKDWGPRAPTSRLFKGWPSAENHLKGKRSLA